MEEAKMQDSSLENNEANEEYKTREDGTRPVSNKTKLIYEAIGGNDNIEHIDHFDIIDIYQLK